MKITQFFAGILTSIWFISSIISGEKATAGSARGFYCDYFRGEHTTMADTSRGQVPVIHWDSVYFKSSGYDPLTRCKQVSARFEIYHRNNQLQYLTTDRQNGLDIICAANFDGGTCCESGSNGEDCEKRLLFTLKPDGRDPGQVLRELMRVRMGGTSLRETSQRLYINVSEFLTTTPVYSQQDQFDSETFPNPNNTTNKSEPISPDQPVRETFYPLW